MQRIEEILSSIVPDTNDTFLLERTLRTRGFSCVAGLDEVGRGPLAGPVVAACVVLPPHCDFSLYLDSKKLSHNRRCLLAGTLSEIGALMGVGIVSIATIDRINILQASLLAMKRAVENLASTLPAPDFLLIDGKFKIPMDTPQFTLIKGESKSASIAAASILAKVTRDALMDELATQFPVYNLSRNKGYPTREHRKAIVKYGPAPCHRKTFKGVKEFV
ncbi:MAG: ribonuclease HII [Desulfocapsaceae bacterium]|nr:ribonuclease HII [Desulfocapsaceae bacterium]